MKPIVLSLIAFLLTISLFSCSRDYDSYLSSSVQEILTRSAWSVEIQDTSQMTSHNYSGYTLLFDPSGAVVSKKNNDYCTGGWQNINELIILKFNCADVNVLSLNKSWKIVSKSTSAIEFQSQNQPAHELILTKQ